MRKDSIKLSTEDNILVGRHWAYNLFNDPKRFAFVLSRYNFAAQMVSASETVLELGCSEGIGVPLFKQFGIRFTGVDMDRDAISTAKQNWKNTDHSFICDDFLGKTYGIFGAVVSLDVIEHISSEYEDSFLETITDNINQSGVAIVGTPNITASQYASLASQKGHINLFSAERLRTVLKRFFHKVFIFGMNDEVVHTGFYPMAHYLIAVACKKKQETGNE
ncbi:MAG: class I SAM-dependent methyltransferase [bacterium]|nr:class I SAM-dependent methyltransferase [bacterium]